MPEMIRCPQCNAEIEVTQALADTLSARLRGEILKEASAREKELARLADALDQQQRHLDATVAERLGAQKVRLEQEAAARAREEAAAELASLGSELATAKESLAAARQAETALKRRERELEEREQSVEGKVEQRLDEERKRIREAAREQALKEAQQESARTAELLEDLQRQLGDRESKLKEARQKEIDLLKKHRELDDRQAALELELERRLAEEGTRIRDAARKEAHEQHLMAERQKDEQIEGLRRKIEELKQRAEQGSQQLQGEAQELVLEEVLRDAFRHDAIEPVPKGVHGGDVVQHVHDASGSHCGTILWESKRTRTWSDGWLPKLRDDQREAKANLAMLVSQALPQGCETFESISEVWVTSWSCAIPLARALRSELIQVAAAKRAIEGQHGKMEILYEYLSGAQFKNRVAGMVEAFTALRHDLDAERRAMFRLWAKREQQLERALLSSSGFYGDLQGIIGGALPELEGLSFPTLPAGDETAHALAGATESDDDLARVLSTLERRGGELSRSDIVSATGLNDAQWTVVAAALAVDPRVEKTGRGRGTRYRFVGEDLGRLE